MARVSGLTTGLTIRYLKQGDSLNGDSVVNNFDGWSTTDSSDLAQNSSWWTVGNGLIRNFEQNFLTLPSPSNISRRTQRQQVTSVL